MRKCMTLKSTMLILVVLFANVVFCPVSRAVLKGGCAKVNITPPLGIPLIGSKGEPSDNVLEKLYAKAMVLDDGNNTIAIVSADLLYTPLEEITGPVRGIVKEKLGIGEQNVLVCATHTHSGPEVFTRSKFVPEQEVPASKIDQSYLKTLVEKIASSVLLAHKGMQEVKIGAAKGQVPEIVYNRRPRDSNGLVKMAFTLEAEVRATRKVEVDGAGLTRVTFTFPEGQTQLHFGPIDPEVCVLRMEDTDGQIVGSLVNFGCHPVCIYPYLSTAISADYPVCATRVVERAEGGLCLFALGLAGNAVPFNRGVTPRRQIGRALGGEALKQLQFATTAGNVTLKALRKEISLPTKKRPSPDEAADEDSPAEPVTTEIQVLKLGDAYILGLPGEVLVEVGLEIKARAGLENLFIATICNDAIGYVCHRTAYEEGGYEPGSATNLAKGAAELMIEQALDLLKRVK